MENGKTYRMTVQYDGTRYLGWQKLGERGSRDYQRTIQGKLEGVLTKLTGEEIEVQGAGRTDAGVHALGQTASFHTRYDAPPDELRAYLNRYLPEDIAVAEVLEAPARFHARLHARGKTYRYALHLSDTPDVFRGRFEYRLGDALDLEVMARGAERLAGTHDFRYFSAAKRVKKSTVRTLSAIDLTPDGERLYLTYRGDGFLYNMVRILTGTLIELGRGERDIEGLDDVFAGKAPAGYTAPARGLTLMNVEY